MPTAERTAPPDHQAPENTPGAFSSVEVDEAPVRRNFAVMALIQIVMRTGWIFKTESVIMPAVLDTLGGAGWLRGFLPTLNRIGNSVPPLLLTRRVKLLPHKKRALALASLGMAAAFLLLASMWLLPAPADAAAEQARRFWMPLAFLVLYSLFFAATGVQQIVFQTLQGKLVRITRRGRLLLVTNAVGCTTAIAAVYFLLPLWLTNDAAQVQYIFGFAGFCFLLAAGACLLLVEPADNFSHPPERVRDVFAASARVLRTDSNFRRLACAGLLFGTTFMLFPHYQALGRQRLGLHMTHLIFWVIVQNLGTGLFSVLAGPIADRSGNRRVLKCLLFGICLIPLVAILLAHAGDWGKSWFFVVFALVGMTPVTMRTFSNYTLEISSSEDHTRYLATLSLCLAAPVMFSPLVGMLVDVTSFEAVFLGVALLNAAAWCLSFGLQEPRHDTPPPPDLATDAVLAPNAEDAV